MAYDAIRSFNKRILNPLTLKLAYLPHSIFAIVHHVGRRSGKAYETPVIVEPLGNGFVFELTYGSKVDWYRNVVAAGHCTLFWHGRVYTLGPPQPLPADQGLAAFPLPARLILRLLDRHTFVLMPQVSIAPAAATKN